MANLWPVMDSAQYFQISVSLTSRTTFPTKTKVLETFPTVSRRVEHVCLTFPPSPLELWTPRSKLWGESEAYFDRMFCSSPHDFLVTTQLTEPLEHFKTSRFLSVRAEQQEVAICWCIPVNINQCLNRHLYIIHGPDATFHQQSIDNLPVSRFRVQY